MTTRCKNTNPNVFPWKFWRANQKYPILGILKSRRNIFRNFVYLTMINEEHDRE